MDTSTIVPHKTIIETVTELAQQFGVERVYLFGSYAKNEQTPESDIDLRVDKGRAKGLQLASLLIALEDAFNKKVDLVTTGGLSNKFLNEIAASEEKIYDANN